MRCYIYCTKAKPYLYRIDDDDEFELRKQITHSDAIDDFNFVKDYREQNGKVVASFELKQAEKFNANNISKEILKKSCLTKDAISNYLGDKNGYGWKIDNLQILYNALDLSSFYRSVGYSDIGINEVCDCCSSWNKSCNDCYWNFELLPMLKAPQSWCHAWFQGEKCILISIRPKWAELILNGKKTLEIRKTYPKEIKLE